MNHYGQQKKKVTDKAVRLTVKLDIKFCKPNSEVRRYFFALRGLRHAKTCLWVYADSEGPDQPAHPRSLIRAFIVRLKNHWIVQNIGMRAKARMILCACTGLSKSAYFTHVRKYIFA